VGRRRWRWKARGRKSQTEAWNTNEEPATRTWEASPEEIQIAVL
jgi:hypothetical protein